LAFSFPAAFACDRQQHLALSGDEPFWLLTFGRQWRFRLLSRKATLDHLNDSVLESIFELFRLEIVSVRACRRACPAI
jgi:hypothetical protein